MGQNESQSYSIDKFDFIQYHHDKQFGQCEIHRTKQPIFQYFLKVHHNIETQHIQPLQQSFANFQYLYYQTDSFPFLRIINFNFNQSSSCKLPEVSFFVEFFRHNLKNFIEWRKNIARQLSYDEIVMTLHKAIIAFDQILNYKLLGFTLDTQQIYLTVEGEIKFNPLSKNFQKFMISNRFQSQNHQNSAFKQKIIQKRSYEEDTESVKTSKGLSYKKQEEFLTQLKNLANQLVWDCKDETKNSEVEYLPARKQTKKLLISIHKAQNIKQVKRLIGKPRTHHFDFAFQKQKFQQLQARFQRRKSEMQSQSTAYSRRDSINPQNLINSNKNNYSAKHIL